MELDFEGTIYVTGTSSGIGKDIYNELKKRKKNTVRIKIRNEKNGNKINISNIIKDGDTLIYAGWPDVGLLDSAEHVKFADQTIELLESIKEIKVKVFMLGTIYEYNEIVFEKDIKKKLPLTNYGYGKLKVREYIKSQKKEKCEFTWIIINYLWGKRRKGNLKDQLEKARITKKTVKLNSETKMGSIMEYDAFMIKLMEIFDKKQKGVLEIKNNSVININEYIKNRITEEYPDIKIAYEKNQNSIVKYHVSKVK